MENFTTSSSEDDFDNSSSSESKSGSEITLLQSSHITTSERLKVCFKPKYDIRKLKNKGAVLVLVFNFLITSVFYYFSRFSFDSCSTCLKLILIPIGIILTLAGSLADIRFGRYKVIYWSSLIMWTSAVALVLTLIIEHVLENKYVQPFALIFVGTLGIGYGGFQANIIQFGIDQLTDASTSELLSFVNWYAWTYVGSGVAAIFASSCMSQPYELILPLLICLCISIVVCLLFFFDQEFIKEPVTQNPFIQIYKVIKYAKTTKCPQNRSAFTYCEDELPSRLDFGKSKYGGPFTVEQVEDVKTCLRSIGLMVLLSLVYGMSEEKVLKLSMNPHGHHKDNDPGKPGQWWSDFIFNNIYSISGALLIPLNEFFVHPLFRRCLPNVLCYWKVIIGIIIHLARYVVLIVLITMAQHEYINAIGSTTNNTSIQCIFSRDTEFLNHTIDYRWFSLPEILSAISFILIIVGTIEFYCAQVPYSMKGVVAGTFYGLFLLFHVVSNAIPKLFTIRPIWKSGEIFSCGFWYLVTKVILLLAVMTILVVGLTCYKKRKREDVLPNEQIFAERYYDTSVD